MEKFNALKDVFKRPARYLGDIRRCTPLFFSFGTVAYAGATGTVGGFAIGAIPAMAIQGSVTLFLGAQQAAATYTGQHYNAPMKGLALSYWATSAALIFGALNAGTTLAVVVASLPAVVLTLWGRTAWDLHKFTCRLEKIQQEGKERGLSEDEIGALVENDPEAALHMKNFQKISGVADISAIVTASIKGESISQISRNFASGIASWESLLPMAFFATGFIKASSAKGMALVDSYTPQFLRKVFGTATGAMTPSRWYSLGYAVAGLSALLTGLGTSEIVQALGFAVAYMSWAHGYAVLDEAKPLPESADEYSASIKSQGGPDVSLK